MNVILLYIYLKCVVLFNRFRVIGLKDLCFILQKSHLTCVRRMRACACELSDIKVKRQKIERNSISLIRPKTSVKGRWVFASIQCPTQHGKSMSITHILLFLNKPRTAMARKLHYSSISFWLNIFLPRIYQPCV